MLAASVGAATPPMIEPSTATTSAIGGRPTFSTLSQSSLRGIARRSSSGIGGTFSGQMMPTAMIQMQKIAESSRPGRTAAANNVPTDSPRMSARRMRIVLGGMSWPRVPEAQIVPQARLLS